MMWCGAVLPPMTRPSREPDRLARGKRFHRAIAEEWRRTAEGDVRVERAVTTPAGRRGRIDVSVDADERLVAVVEIKDTDWNIMTPAAVERALRRHARQVARYVEARLAEGKAVSPGIVYAQAPRNPGRRERIEAYFDGELVAVVWQDEVGRLPP